MFLLIYIQLSSRVQRFRQDLILKERVLSNPPNTPTEYYKKLTCQGRWPNLSEDKATFKQHWKHAFGLESDNAGKAHPLPAPLERFAREVVDRGMETPAILFLETIRPLNFLASQTLRAAQPLIQWGIPSDAYHSVAAALERRETIPTLIACIETLSRKTGEER